MSIRYEDERTRIEFGRDVVFVLVTLDKLGRARKRGPQAHLPHHANLRNIDRSFLSSPTWHKVPLALFGSH